MRSITIDDNASILEIMKLILEKTDPNGFHRFAASAAEGLEIIGREHIEIVFLDMEMPGVSGDDTLRILKENSPEIDVIIITGHPEYALLGHQLHCNGFVVKPFGENEITEALKWLRRPVKLGKALKVSCRNGFEMYSNSGVFSFQKKLTQSIFAYLIYKNGAAVSNGELLAVFYEGDPEKSEVLRKYTKDMRDSLKAVGADKVLNKKRGEIGLFMDEIEVDGDTSVLPDLFDWIE